MILALVSAIALSMMISLLRPASRRFRLTHGHRLIIRIILRRNRRRLRLMLLLLLLIIAAIAIAPLIIVVVSLGCLRVLVVTFGSFGTSGFGHAVGALARGGNVIADAMGDFVA